MTFPYGHLCLLEWAASEAAEKEAALARMRQEKAKLLGTEPEMRGFMLHK